MQIVWMQAAKSIRGEYGTRKISLADTEKAVIFVQEAAFFYVYININNQFPTRLPLPGGALWSDEYFEGGDNSHDIRTGIRKKGK